MTTSNPRILQPGEVFTMVPTGALAWIDGVLHQGFQEVSRGGKVWCVVPTITTTPTEPALARHDAQADTAGDGG